MAKSGNDPLELDTSASAVHWRRERHIQNGIIADAIPCRSQGILVERLFIVLYVRILVTRLARFIGKLAMAYSVTVRQSTSDSDNPPSSQRTWNDSDGIDRWLAGAPRDRHGKQGPGNSAE
jgi:hypothetical protein